MKKIIPFLLLTAFLFVSCKPAEEQIPRPSTVDSSQAMIEQKRIKNTIILYNALLAKGYKIQNMNTLAEAATKKRAMKAYYHMAALGEGNMKMDSKLLTIDLTDLQILSELRATIISSEKWDYSYLNTGTGGKVYENTVDYKLRYHLEKDGGRWYVDDIEVLETKEKNPEKFNMMSRDHGIQGKSNE